MTPRNANTSAPSSSSFLDKSECANQLVGLATCLPYVGGEAKAPTQDCCTGLKQVLKNNKKCLCILVKDRNDPSLGLKVNATLALGLPQNCHVPNKDNISECPGNRLSSNASESTQATDISKTKLFITVANKDEVEAGAGCQIDPIDLNHFFDNDGKIYGYQGLKITGVRRQSGGRPQEPVG